MNVDSIPQRLREFDQWIVWRTVTRDGRPTKPPFDYRTDRPGDATDPSLWMPFDDMLSVVAAYDGAGFVVTPDDPFTGVDIDKCILADGQLTPEAIVLVGKLDSYTEVTPSGVGLRVWVEGRLPPGRRRRDNVEFYDAGRYFTVTGNHLDGTPVEILPRSVELLEQHTRIFPPERNGARAANVARGGARARLGDGGDDGALLLKMLDSANGRKIAALLAGDTTGFSSHSEADLALCSHLAFWTRGDAEAVDRMFRQSALFRDKWDRPDYREPTIARALQQIAMYDSWTALAIRESVPPPNPRNEWPGVNGNRLRPEPEDVDPLPSLADDPHRLARTMLHNDFSHADGLKLRTWKGNLYHWDGLAWRIRTNEQIQARVTRSVKQQVDELAAGTGKPPIKVITGLVANVIQAVRAETAIWDEDCEAQPTWLKGKGPTEAGEDLPDPRRVIATTSGIVDLDAYAAGGHHLIPLTPRLFTTVNVGYAFDREAPDPVRWLEFLAQLWPKDQEAIDCLQEWFGHLLAPNTRIHKILLIQGPPRSGKGTIARVLRHMVGKENVVMPNMSGLGEDFASQQLIDKSVAIIPDARLSGKKDVESIVEKLLSISGEDGQSINRKNKEYWSGILPTRFVMLCNLMPRFGDASNAIASRMIILRLVESFLGREDSELEDKLKPELPSILLWAIRGWIRLRERGRFVQPASGVELVMELEDLGSPMGMFVQEKCVVGITHSVDTKRLYEAWVAFCREIGKDHPGDSTAFGKNLRGVLPTLTTQQSRAGGVRNRLFIGLNLQSGLPY